MSAEDTGPKYPECTVRLTGEDGNVFVIIGRVRVHLRRHLVENGVGYAEARRRVDEFAAEVIAAESYDDALGVVTRWVDVA